MDGEDDDKEIQWELIGVAQIAADNAEDIYLLCDQPNRDMESMQN